MRTSKFVGKTFDNGWKCIAVYLAANYSHGTRHNAYRYELMRRTHDGLCDKIITVRGSTMTKIARGEKLVEDIANYKKSRGNSGTRISDDVLHRYN